MEPAPGAGAGTPVSRPGVGTLAIVGPGRLGLGLAAFAARRGLEVRLAGRNAAHADAGLARIQASWAHRAAGGPPPAPDHPAADLRLRATPSVEAALDGADCVLEAVAESQAVKAPVWSRIARAAATDTLLLTGSSSLPLRELRERSGVPRPILGFHLFLPLERMDALELVVEAGTPKALVDRAEALAERLGRRIFRVEDGPGYAASRMALAQGLEAMRLLDRGVASAEHLDGLMVHGYGHPVGPLELSDRIGLDLRLAIAEGLFETTGDHAYAPPQALVQRVQAGRLGRKSGEGFYRWDPEGRRR